MSNGEQHYRVLNLDPTATPEQIYQAYRDLARVWDPQRFSHSPRLEMMAEAKLQEIIAAYHALQPSGFPEGSALPGSVAVETSAPPLPWDEPAHPLASTERSSVPWAPVADLHRPVELGSIPAPPPRPPAVYPIEPPPALEPRGRFGLPLPVESPRTVEPARAMETGWESRIPTAQPPGPTLSAANPPGVPEEPVAAAPGDMPAPATQPSRRITLAVVAATGLLLVGAGVFLREAVSGPAHRGPTPAAIPAETVPVDDSVIGAPVAEGKGEVKGLDNRVPKPETAAPAAPKRSRRLIPEPQEPLQELTSGAELMPPQGRRGAGKFKLINHSGQDAVARISAQAAPSSALRLVYVKSGTEVVVGGIGTGVYFVSFAMGPVRSRLRPFGARFGPFQFIQIESANGAQSDQYQIALKPGDN
jgi:hypothetical protein